ncbi:outer membrane protein assembly factor BamB family protein [Yinghuangia soli]|uniref:PQQ-binding-like beta-propeller repeat protein n=1 Tax=Yinghuangia soli TaxID=2908204 RepID=A0AA41U4Z6_9ACTN|nr:PQQ-binding-like beta-propeller repeat protein [Yinghuangia soli]MCF2533460.1 PQQ-binding-like beta-propeller repeat protein [Yinghuangia soli]
MSSPLVRRRQALLGALGAAGSVLVGCSNDGGPARAKPSPQQSLPQGTVRWTFESYGTAAVTPAFAHGKLFVGGASVFALDPGDGRVLWERKTDDIADCTPVIVGDALIVTGGDLQALDAQTGAVRWRRPAVSGGGFHHASHADGLVVAGSGPTEVRAVDAATGEDRWHTPLGGHLLEPPRVADGTIYLSCADGLHALDASTGARRWSADTEGSLITAATIAGTQAFIGMAKSQSVGVLGVRAIDTASGRTLWHAKTDGFVGAPPLLDGHTLHATDASGAVLVVDPLTGAIRTRTDIEDAGHGLALDRGVLYTCGVNNLTALNAATHTPLWSSRPDAFGLNTALPLQDTVILGDDAGIIRAIAGPARTPQ